MENNKDNLKIYQKYMDLIYYTNDILRKYPKAETFALVKETKETTYLGMRFLICALKAYSVKDKLKYLNELDLQLSLLKIHIRLSFKYKYITTQNYNSWSSLITDISNMLGGWVKSCQRK